MSSLSSVHLDCHGQPLLARNTRLSAEHLGLESGHDVTALIKTVALATLNDSLSNERRGDTRHAETRDATGPTHG